MLTYCTNIHAGESWEDHFMALKLHFPSIKKEVSPLKPMGIGLRLSNVASVELIQPGKLHLFREWLKQNDAYIFTMNGFPYGGFHNTVVKDKVHFPDWTTNERIEYTFRLFDILVELLPEYVEGGISTSPLSYRHWFTGNEEAASIKHKATRNILLVAEKLINIHKSTGKLLHLDIEPEPDGMLETGQEFINWFKEILLPAGIPMIAANFNVSEAEAEKMIKAHIHICYDVCHFAIGYEPHAAIIEQLKIEGIRVGKIQISAALKALMPAEEAAREPISAAFAAFNEPTYLHQVVACKDDGSFLRYPDLADALQDANNLHVKEWRAHFHVPVFLEDFGLLQSTQADILEVLSLQKIGSLTKHLEVETYTWEVLPPELKLPLQQSIVRELLWVKEQMRYEV